MKSSKNDPVRSTHLRKVYADMSKSSEMRLRKIIEEDVFLVLFVMLGKIMVKISGIYEGEKHCELTL